MKKFRDRLFISVFFTFCFGASAAFFIIVVPMVIMDDLVGTSMIDWLFEQLPTHLAQVSFVLGLGGVIAVFHFLPSEYMQNDRPDRDV